MQNVGGVWGRNKKSKYSTSRRMRTQIWFFANNSETVAFTTKDVLYKLKEDKISYIFCSTRMLGVTAP